MTKYLEVDFGGIPGPFHNYGGLAFGNMASSNNQGTVSRPREAALQALGKIKSLHDMGLHTAILPPQPRPDFKTLRSRNYQGNEAEILESCRRDPKLLAQVYSSAFMWTANAATVAPSVDTADKRLRLVTANLAANLHRSIEAPQTFMVLKHVFNGKKNFFVSPALHSNSLLGDEGAANHMRLAPSHGEKGLHVFVYGADDEVGPKKFPARQTLLASRMVANLLKLDEDNTVYIRQNPDVIDKGVFHNDVISVSNENVLLYHEEAFAEPSAVDEISNAYRRLHPGKELVLIKVKSADLSVEDAVKTYFFNSQIVTLPSGKMAIIAPKETESHDAANGLMERIKNDKSNPIEKIIYKDLSQSMRNGGGPACLRLRVVMSEEEKALLTSKVNIFMTEALNVELTRWIHKHYREELKPEDLFDIKLYQETLAALQELSKIMRIPILQPTHDIVR